ncbi:hypothetical protein lerEdw1_009929 [Lerista edwardsae]|nr:hypothetical protein lerEdw1_009929 [Lerista edwardsae]
MAKAAHKIMESLEALENASLGVVVTGESGSGKSSFDNAIRGLEDEDDGASPTGVVETTMVPTSKPHPKHPNVTVWDLPGIGTPHFQPSTYLEKVAFSRDNFFILVASEHYKANRAQLAHEIRKMGKRFYFMWSRADADLEATRRRRPQAYNESILGEIQSNSQQCLQDARINCLQIFLLANWELNQYDLMVLEETMKKELPRHNRHAFLMALPDISFEVLQKKKVLQKQMWKWAIASCGVAAVPIPGLSVACDAAVQIKSLLRYCQSFDLDDESLDKLVEKVAKPRDEIKEVTESPLAKEISWDLVPKLLTGRLLMAVKYFISTVLIFGPLVASSISFGKTSYMLWSCLNELVEDAHCVLLQAFEADV